MKLSISNIAWNAETDGIIYKMMIRYGFHGLEVAPTRIISQQPYDRLTQIRAWTDEIESRYHFEIPSMQSIWFGRTEQMFNSADERSILLDYTKKAVDFAAVARCHNLVFGNPKSRNLKNSGDEDHAVEFFRKVGDYAASRGTVIGLEANPAIYSTNFINDTASAINFIHRVDSKGFMLNLDVGTMIANGETVEVLSGAEELINHVHISEPFLKPIVERNIHKELSSFLKQMNYEGFVSIEMGKCDNIEIIEQAMIYVRDVFA